MNLDIPNISALSPDKSQQFIRQLYSLLRDKEWISFGSGSFAQLNENGCFVTGIYHSNDKDKLNSKKILWIISQDSEGQILKIEVFNEEPNINQIETKEYANKIINNALINAFADYRVEFYSRNYLCFIHTSNLFGSYWINNKLRISPLFPNDIEFGFGLERVIVIDQLIKAIDFQHSLEISEEKSILLAAHLSLLFDIGFYSPEEYISKWVRVNDKESGTVINKRLDLGVIDSTNTLTMPLKKNDDPKQPIYSVFHDKRTFYEQLSFPKETRQILNSLENANFKYKLAFDRCCRLYQTALVKGFRSPTIKYSYLYGSIDAICKTTKEYNGFSEFMRKYNSQISEEELEFIHEKIRSSHWHSGEFILGENESKWRETLFDKQKMIRSNKIQNLQQLIRHAILNWIFEKIVIK